MIISPLGMLKIKILATSLKSLEKHPRFEEMMMELKLDMQDPLVWGPWSEDKNPRSGKVFYRKFYVSEFLDTEIFMSDI